jgi:uncharacterized protein
MFWLVPKLNLGTSHEPTWEQAMQGEAMSGKPREGWNPYLAGALSGLVSILSVWLAGKYLGASTTFVRSTGLIQNLAMPERVAATEYFRQNLPQIDWQWMFVAGILLGSLLAAKTAGDFRWQALPPMWEKRFGATRLKRALIAFVGGAVAMFGARLADG